LVLAGEQRKTHAGRSPIGRLGLEILRPALNRRVRRAAFAPGHHGSTHMRKRWSKPRIVEIAVGLEINAYASAEG
jgi:coenzyme PQQ precursor peptide PqqA